MGKIIDKLRKFFPLVDFRIDETEDVVLLDPKDSIELTELEYNLLYDFLRSLGFSLINMWGNRLSDFWDYRSYAGFDEFEDDDGNRVTVYYTKISTNDGTVYYIDKIRIEES